MNDLSNLAALPETAKPRVRLTQLLWFLPSVLAMLGVASLFFSPGILFTLLGSAKIQVSTADGWETLPIPGDLARGLESTPDGTVWAVTARDLYRWVEGQKNWESIYSTGDHIIEMAVDETLIWLSNKKAVVRCDSVELTCEVAHHLDEGSSIAAFNHQVLAVSTNSVGLHYNGKDWRSFTLASELPGFNAKDAPGYLSDVAITSDGTLWIEWGQLWRLPPDSQAWVLATYTQQPPVNVKIIGAEGNYLWTEWSNGISKDKPNLTGWSFFYWEDVGKRYFDRIFDITSGPDGSVWFGVEDGLLNYKNNHSFDLISLPSNDRVTEVVVLPDEQIWVQTTAAGANSWVRIIPALAIVLFLPYTLRRAMRGLI